MTTLRIHCPLCGIHHLPLHAVTVTIAEHGARYSFVCPVCSDTVSNEIRPGAVDEIVESGGRVILLPPQPDSLAPPINDVDCFRFGEEIAGLTYLAWYAGAS
jgi:hypothetical protein